MAAQSVVRSCFWGVAGTCASVPPAVYAAGRRAPFRSGCGKAAGIPGSLDTGSPAGAMLFHVSGRGREFHRCRLDMHHFALDGKLV